MLDSFTPSSSEALINKHNFGIYGMDGKHSLAMVSQSKDPLRIQARKDATIYLREGPREE